MKMPTYIKLHINKKILWGRILRISTVKPCKLTRIWGAPPYGNYSTTRNFFVTSFKTPAIGHHDKTMALMKIHLMPILMLRIVV